MKRRITEYLKKWKDRETRKPLIVRGARQCGKSYSIIEFGKTCFDNFLEINLEQRQDVKSIFYSQQPDKIINEISILYQHKIEAGKTLLFIDEIQACPEAIVSLRYFYEQIPELHVIAAGSLLEHTLNEMKYSMPVGRVEFCNMFPMSFEEFLLACREDLLLDYLKRWTPDSEFSPAIHQKALELMRQHFFVGGMPEAVASFINSADLLDVERIQKSILMTYEYDFSKYGTKTQTTHLQKMFAYLSMNSCKKVKFSNIDNNLRSNVLVEALYKLERSKIVHLVKHSSAGQIPLRNFVDDTKFKPIFLDIGLSNRMGNIRLMDIADIYTSFEGMLAEQFAGQELLNITDFYDEPQLYYWLKENKKSNAEVDYLIQHNNKILPIEIKSGLSGTMKSLQVFLHEKKLTNAIRFNLNLPELKSYSHKISSGGEIHNVNFNLLSLPLYMVFRVKELNGIAFAD